MVKKILKDFDWRAEDFAERKFCDLHLIAGDFSKLDLGDSEWDKCLFADCNFSLAQLEKVGFTKCKFAGCKFLGVKFPSLARLHFENCLINNCSFAGCNLSHSHFRDCEIVDNKFLEADLRGAIFAGNCNFTDSTFQKCNLEGADLGGAFHYLVDPHNNKLTGTKFALPAALSFFSFFDFKLC